MPRPRAAEHAAHQLDLQQREGRRGLGILETKRLFVEAEAAGRAKAAEREVGQVAVARALPGPRGQALDEAALQLEQARRGVGLRSDQVGTFQMDVMMFSQFC